MLTSTALLQYSLVADSISLMPYQYFRRTSSTIQGELTTQNNFEQTFLGERERQMVYSLDNLPVALQTAVLQYVTDPRTICALEQSSKSLLQVIQESGCWKRLHQNRWTYSSLTSREILQQPVNNSDTGGPTKWKSDYIRRYEIDTTTLSCIDRLASEVGDGETVQTVTEVLSFGEDCLDFCWQYWQRHKGDKKNNGVADSSNSSVSDSEYSLSREALVSICLLRSVHCSLAFENLRKLCCGSHSIVNANPEAEFEEYAIASSRMFFELGPIDTSLQIRKELDDIGALVRERLTDSPSTEERLDALNYVLFDQLKFKGNSENYYDFENSMLHTSLRRRMAIPMTLAVLYKCVARRIDLHVDIIGLPGHIVIGVPSLNRYVDVFRRGRRLMTVEDCELIVNSYGHSLLPDYLAPLTPSQVFQRILNNCGSCLAQTFPPNASKRMAIETLRAVLINPTHEQVKDCVGWFSQILWGATTGSILIEMSKW